MAELDPFAAARDFDLEDAISKLANRCAEQGMRLTVVHIEATRPDMQINTAHGYVRALYTPKKVGDFVGAALYLHRCANELKDEIAAFKEKYGKPKP